MSLINRFFNSELRRNLLIFVTGNFMVIGISSVTMLLLPKVLSVKDYGIYKTFTLYLSYTSLLHFGLKDGIYLLLCQKRERDFTRDSFYFSWFSYQQIIVSVLILGLAFFLPTYSFFIIFLSLTTFFFIQNTFFDAYSQAFQSFKLPVKLRIIKEVLFLTSIILAWIYPKVNTNFSHKINYQFILIFNLTTVIVLWGLFKYKFASHFTLTKKIKNKAKLIIPAYKRGYKILIGNFAHQFNGNMDKLFVSSFYAKENFAVYSFGAMFFFVVNMVAANVAQVFLPFLYKQNVEKVEENYKKLFLINWYSSLFVIFPVLILISLLIPVFYKDYAEAVKVISLLSLGIFYNVQITISQNNILKRLELDNIYIKNNLISIIIIVLTGICIIYYDLPSEYFALLLSISIFLKYILNDWTIRRMIKTNRFYVQLLNHLVVIFCYLTINIIAFNRI